MWPCKQLERDLILTKFSILFSPLIMKLHWLSSQWVAKSLRAQLVLLGVSTEMSNVQIPLPPTIELSKKNILLGDSRRTCKTSPNYLILLEFFSLIFWTKTRPLSSQNHQHNSSSMSIANAKKRQKFKFAILVCLQPLDLCLFLFLVKFQLQNFQKSQI